MSERCPKARRYGKPPVYKCNPDCVFCHGYALVDACPECEGAGLSLGKRCETCHHTGKVPAIRAAVQQEAPAC